MADHEKSQYASLTLWDIDREFQNAHETYEQIQAVTRRKRTTWECIGGKNQEDQLAKSLCLGRLVQEVVESGTEAFGATFERGDCRLLFMSTL